MYLDRPLHSIVWYENRSMAFTGMCLAQLSPPQKEKAEIMKSYEITLLKNSLILNTIDTCMAMNRGLNQADLLPK